MKAIQSRRRAVSWLLPFENPASSECGRIETTFVTVVGSRAGFAKNPRNGK